MPGVLFDEPDPLDVLEAQVIELEKKIIGYAHINENDAPLAESLVHSNNTINNAILSYEKVKSVFDKIHKLGDYLDPTYEDKLENRMAKIRVVLESESDLRQLLYDLSQISEYDEKIEADTLKNVPNLYDKLRQVSSSVIKLEESFKDTNSNTKILLDKFAKAIRSMNTSMMMFDHILTEMEVKDSIKQADVDI